MSQNSGAVVNEAGSEELSVKSLQGVKRFILDLLAKGLGIEEQAEEVSCLQNWLDAS